MVQEPIDVQGILIVLAVRHTLALAQLVQLRHQERGRTSDPDLEAAPVGRLQSLHSHWASVDQCRLEAADFQRDLFSVSA
jgi:hypothetical protein